MKQALDIQIKDIPAFEIVNAFKIQGMLMAIGLQNAKILAKLNSTTEKEEYQSFIKCSDEQANELPYNDDYVTIISAKE